MVVKDRSSVLSVLRERAALTPRQLADKAGVPESIISALESDGQPVLASAEASIANALGFVGQPKDLREPFCAWEEDHAGEAPIQVAEVVRIDPEIMSGEACFAETRVPIQTLIDYLKAGDSLEYFLIQHPTVTRQQAQNFIQVAANVTVAQTKPAE